MLKSLSCYGYRGFSEKQTLQLAVPNNNLGSGLTVLLGPNGGGKSTIIECFQKIPSNECSFTEGKRNKVAGDRVQISLECDNNQITLSTQKQGGSEAIWSSIERPMVYHLPARRVFNPFFGKAKWNRNQFMQNSHDSQHRASVLEQFSYRLFDALENYDQFNEIFWRVLGKTLHWTIDQNDSSQYYVKIDKGNRCYHNSDGLGEGVVSLMFICDALLNVKENEVIVIDEPELSLHPQLQQRLLKEIMRVSSNNQVVISTHSPHFVSLESAINGGVIARVYESNNGSKISQIDQKCSEYFQSFKSDLNNPHSFGIDAKMCLFSEDNLVLTEGQEDVVLYPQILKQIGIEDDIAFWGFGAGGAEKISKIAYVLLCLGFKNIGAIFDGDKTKEMVAFNSKFNSYGYEAWCIPADDVRDKESRIIKEKTGLLTNKIVIKDDHSIPIKQLFETILKKQKGS